MTKVPSALVVAAVPKNRAALPVAVLTMLLGAPAALWGYTDPGSGTLLFQVLAAVFFSGLFYVRRLTQWFRRFVSGGKQR
jgi:hypothetical protein